MPRTGKNQPSLRPHASLDASQLDAVAALFGLLSESSRLRILQVLKQGPASVSEVIERTGFKQANVSKQLLMLQGAGVVDRKPDGNRAVYSIAMPLVFDLCELVCTGMADRAAAYAVTLSRR